MVKEKTKILIVFKETETDNLFVHILARGIASQGMDIRCSTDLFWNDNDTTYDIIHFQWPEEVVGWNCDDMHMVEKLRLRIDEWRKRGSHFLYTRHNTRPHYANRAINAAYGVIEANSDLVVHMGQYSYDEFVARHPQSRNIIIPHHIYEDTYRENITRKEAREYLGIPQRKFVITAFGKFRNNEEVKMMLKAYFKAKLRRKCLLAPRLFPFSRTPRQSGFIKRLVSKCAYHTIIPLARLWGIRGGGNEEIVSDHDLPYYIAASDVLFVQRKQILNSGNVPLGFLFRKIVIGPDTGNVGELLRATGNPVFDAEDPISIAQAIGQTFALRKKEQGEKNYQYALAHFSLHLVAGQYIDAYNTLNEQ